MELRSSLSNLAADATGKDAAAMSSVINGFDDHINNLISAGKWNGPSGSGVQFLSDYGNARQAYASHMSTYMDPSARNNSAIAAASKSLKDLEGTGASQGDHFRIGSDLASSLVNPRTGNQTYANLKNIFPDTVATNGTNIANPGMQEIHNYLMQDLLKTNPNTHELVRTPDQINALIKANNGNNPYAMAVAANNAQGKIASLNSARRISTQEPTKSAKQADALHAGASLMTKAALKLATVHALEPWGMGGQLAGLTMEGKLDDWLDHWGGKRAAKKEGQGAPSALTGSSKLQNLYRYNVNPMRSTAAANINQTDDREHHASGGRAGPKGHAHLVDRLMSLAESAKRDIKKQTKPILNTDDNVVARALAIAGKNI
jgi:hypothetical protein